MNRTASTLSGVVSLCLIVAIAGISDFPAGLAFEHKTISVDAYGAKPDGSADSTAAVKNAISAALQLGSPAEVVFSTGTYRLDCASPSPIFCFDIKNARNLTIRGQGAGTKLIISNPLAGLLSVSSSTDVIVSGFSVDYSSLPFTQGRITKTYPDQRAIELSVDEGYPALDQPIFAPTHLAQTSGMLFEASLPRLKGDASNSYPVQSISKVSGSVYRVNLSTFQNIAVGDRFALSNRSQHMFYFANTQNFTLKEVILYAAPGAASIWVRNTGRILIDGFQVRRKPGTNHLMSTAADAIHMVDNVGNLTIQRCFIEGMGDDAINIRSNAFTVTNLSSTTNFQFNTAGTQIKAGYTLQAVSPATHLAKGTAEIASVRVAGNMATVSLTRPIPNLAVGDVIFGADLGSPNALIKDNTFSNFRGIFRIRSSGAIFANNSILDTRNARVFVAADITNAWREGPTLVNSLNGVYFDGNTVKGGWIALLGTKYANMGPPTLSGSNALLGHPLVFNAGVYRQLNPDIAFMTDPELSFHWVNHGIAEGRMANADFHAPAYMKLYPDLSKMSYLNAIKHYLMHGAILEMREGGRRAASGGR